MSYPQKSSILKQTKLGNSQPPLSVYKDRDTTTFNAHRRVSFSGKKNIKIFHAGPEEVTIWNNSYEVSDNESYENLALQRSAKNLCEDLSKISKIKSDAENAGYQRYSGMTGTKDFGSIYNKKSFSCNLNAEDEMTGVYATDRLQIPAFINDIPSHERNPPYLEAPNTSRKLVQDFNCIQSKPHEDENPIVNLTNKAKERRKTVVFNPLDDEADMEITEVLPGGNYMEIDYRNFNYGFKNMNEVRLEFESALCRNITPSGETLVAQRFQENGHYEKVQSAISSRQDIENFKCMAYNDISLIKQSTTNNKQLAQNNVSQDIFVNKLCHISTPIQKRKVYDSRLTIEKQLCPNPNFEEPLNKTPKIQYYQNFDSIMAIGKENICIGQNAETRYDNDSLIETEKTEALCNIRPMIPAPLNSSNHATKESPYNGYSSNQERVLNTQNCYAKHGLITPPVHNSNCSNIKYSTSLYSTKLYTPITSSGFIINVPNCKKDERNWPHDENATSNNKLNVPKQYRTHQLLDGIMPSKLASSTTAATACDVADAKQLSENDAATVLAISPPLQFTDSKSLDKENVQHKLRTKHELPSSNQHPHNIIYTASQATQTPQRTHIEKEPAICQTLAEVVLDESILSLSQPTNLICDEKSDVNNVKNENTEMDVEKPAEISIHITTLQQTNLNFNRYSSNDTMYPGIYYENGTQCLQTQSNLKKSRNDDIEQLVDELEKRLQKELKTLLEKNSKDKSFMELTYSLYNHGQRKLKKKTESCTENLKRLLFMKSISQSTCITVLEISGRKWVFQVYELVVVTVSFLGDSLDDNSIAAVSNVEVALGIQDLKLPYEHVIQNAFKKIALPHDMLGSAEKRDGIPNLLIKLADEYRPIRDLMSELELLVIAHDLKFEDCIMKQYFFPVSLDAMFELRINLADYNKTLSWNNVKIENIYGDVSIDRIKDVYDTIKMNGELFLTRFLHSLREKLYNESLSV